ncbi:MAG: Rha family transcriptional regulator, partial [Deltaproteobacteria bacterium]|nr:Rha family transcriptional regulator [Deltaproteobacteria bacterium]
MATDQDIHIQVVENHPMVTSVEVAMKFGKIHRNVMRDIKGLECSVEFNALNFEHIDYVDTAKRKQKMVKMTRDGFTFLCM